MVRILDLRARQILDSRAQPTIETEILTSTGWTRASVPSGASTGIHEAVELRDHKRAYLGKGVLAAVKNVASLKNKLAGKTWTQHSLDTFLNATDGTPNKRKLGANTILSISMAHARAQAAHDDTPLYAHLAQLHGTKKTRLPVPAFNIINGGAHSDSGLDIQEYQILPTKAKNIAHALQIGSEVYHILKTLIHNDYGRGSTNIGDEGGFAPPFTNNTTPFDYILDAIDQAGYRKHVTLGIDAAASEFHKNGTYHINGKKHTAEQLTHWYEQLCKDYPLASIEDPFNQDDFDAFAHLHKKLKRVQIIGDDLTVTNPKRIQTAIDKHSCDCLLLKLNQIGSVTEALDAAALSQRAKWNVQVSHRSGETTDDFIADLAVGIGAHQIKSGAPARGERNAKYNQLLRIEEHLGRKARYGP